LRRQQENAEQAQRRVRATVEFNQYQREKYFVTNP
jgi:hypothetical protein